MPYRRSAAARPYRTKPGKYGTLYLYRVIYRNRFVPDETFITNLWAYNPEHAEERFDDEGESEFRIVGMERARD